MFLYALSVFLSAFLLFQVQPMIAKMILPWFGGSAAVWGTCLVFFQAVLLLGYFYAHLLTSTWRPRRQAIIHSVLLGLAVLTLPIMPSALWKPVDPSLPSLKILTLLCVVVGLPYFALSSTGPLLQKWYVQAHPGKMPYRLFALSNFGSMLALLSYPPLIEPNLTLPTQSWSWSAGFGLFAVICIMTGWRSATKAVATEDAVPSEQSPRPTPGLYFFWIALAACPSILLLSVTTHLSMDVAPVPFLWIVPLALYLLSFILCFDAPRWYRRREFLILAPLALGGMLWMMQAEASERPPIRITVALFALAFFVLCMVCHGELARWKPNPRWLTSYYLMISIGGAIGGLFVALVAPSVFKAFFEFPISVVLCALLIGGSLYWEKDSIFRRDLLGWPSIAVMCTVAALAGFSFYVMRETVIGSMFVGRNFYGELRVRQYENPYDWDGYRSLVHGSINHGEQYTHPARRRLPVSYYCADTGVGMVMAERVVGDTGRVGVIGLGTGTMAAYSRFGDYFRFYEINPLVEKIANQYFTYIKDAEGPVDVVLGDARLSLEREEPEEFDVLVVDAFSSDSIPVHLLTREAFQLYFKHLKPNGVLAVHISNRYIDLKPVIGRVAESIGRKAWAVESQDNDEGTCYSTTWTLITAREDLLQRKRFKDAGIARIEKANWLPVWTDNYSNIYRVLK